MKVTFHTFNMQYDDGNPFSHPSSLFFFPILSTFKTLKWVKKDEEANYQTSIAKSYRITYKN